MVLLQHKLNVKLSQRQILTPGLVQMVSVLALNKLELKDMINAEMVENPVLEELEDAIPMLDDVGRQEEERDRLAAKATAPEEGPATIADEKKDPFEEIDFGSFFQDYLDPGYRSSGEMEEIEKPSFENFLSKPGNLSDYLLWQLGAISVRPPVHQAAELIIGNLNEEGYLIASDEELLGIAPVAAPEADVKVATKIIGEAEALGLAVAETQTLHSETSDLEPEIQTSEDLVLEDAVFLAATTEGTGTESLVEQSLVEQDAPTEVDSDPDVSSAIAAEATPLSAANHGSTVTGAATAPARISDINFTVADLHEALEVVRQFDPPGIACRTTSRASCR